MLTPSRPLSPRRQAQSGAIMILVALMLLVFLTIAAAGMTRNSFREILTSGTTRQSVMARNVADSGVEWTLLWMYGPNTPKATSASAAAVAGPSGLMNTLLSNSATMSGKYYNFGTTAASPIAYTVPGSQTMPSDLTLSTTATGVKEGFTIAMMAMGHLEARDTSQGSTQGTYRPGTPDTSSQSIGPNIWAVRSDGQVTFSGLTFRQSREAWISTPVTAAK
jgi:Tfp pilus assembly protein PilX